MVCLKEDEVIAIVSGVMAGDALAKAEAHIDTCRACRLLLSALATRTGELGHAGHLSAFATGDVIAKRYRVLRLIGAGGMGEVYEAMDLELRDRVALKTIAVGAELDAAGVARLKAEVQVARRVTHRNVCRVFDVGYHNELGGDGAAEALAIPFFTMELLPGETLGQLIRRRGPCSPAEALLLIEQVAAGLEALHRSGVIHSDLKSDNIMLVPEAAGTRAVITDFGLARRLDGRARRTDRSMTVAGTIGYMAPEQFGDAKTTRRTDVYALGIILYELLTGRLPFTAQALAASAREGTPPEPPTVSSAEVPNVWVAVIERCMDPTPSARFANADEVVAALRSATSLRRATSWRRVAVVAAVVGALLASVASLVTVLLTQPSKPHVPPQQAVDTRSPAVAPPPDAAPAVIDGGAGPTTPPRGHRGKRPGRGTGGKPPSTSPSRTPPGEDDMIDPRGWR